MINLNHLRIFYCVAKNMSFTKAAKELFITQPAVTAQMKLFEEWCELKFFKKKGRGIILTDVGKVLYAHACKIFEYEKGIESAIDDLRQLKQGVLRLGTTKTYVRLFLPFLIQSFSEKYPMIRMCIDEGSSMDIIESLVKLRNEIAIITKVVDHPAVTFIPFSEEELIPIFSPRHPLAKKTHVSVEELANEPIIMREAGSGTRKFVAKFFEDHGYVPNILMETVNSEFIKQLVARGTGISILVREAVLRELGQKKLVTVPIEGKKIYLDACVAYLKNQPLSLPARVFLDTLEGLCNGEMPIKGIRSLLEKHDRPVKAIRTDACGFVDFGIG